MSRFDIQDRLQGSFSVFELLPTAGGEEYLTLDLGLRARCPHGEPNSMIQSNGLIGMSALTFTSKPACNHGAIAGD